MPLTEHCSGSRSLPRLSRWKKSRWPQQHQHANNKIGVRENRAMKINKRVFTKLYTKQQWDAAAKIIEECDAKYPNDDLRAEFESIERIVDEVMTSETPAQIQLMRYLLAEKLESAVSDAL